MAKDDEGVAAKTANYVKHHGMMTVQAACGVAIFVIFTIHSADKDQFPVLKIQPYRGTGMASGGASYSAKELQAFAHMMGTGSMTCGKDSDGQTQVTHAMAYDNGNKDCRNGADENNYKDCAAGKKDCGDVWVQGVDSKWYSAHANGGSLIVPLKKKQESNSEWVYCAKLKDPLPLAQYVTVDATGDLDQQKIDQGTTKTPDSSNGWFISRGLVCDGYSHCDKDADEKDCVTYACPDKSGHTITFRENEKIDWAMYAAHCMGENGVINPNSQGPNPGQHLYTTAYADWGKDDSASVKFYAATSTVMAAADQESMMRYITSGGKSAIVGTTGNYAVDAVGHGQDHSSATHPGLDGTTNADETTHIIKGNIKRSDICDTKFFIEGEDTDSYSPLETNAWTENTHTVAYGTDLIATGVATPNSEDQFSADDEGPIFGGDFPHVCCAYLTIEELMSDTFAKGHASVAAHVAGTPAPTAANGVCKGMKDPNSVCESKADYAATFAADKSCTTDITDDAKVLAYQKDVQFMRSVCDSLLVGMPGNSSHTRAKHLLSKECLVGKAVAVPRMDHPVVLNIAPSGETCCAGKPHEQVWFLTTTALAQHNKYGLGSTEGLDDKVSAIHTPDTVLSSLGVKAVYDIKDATVAKAFCKAQVTDSMCGYKTQLGRNVANPISIIKSARRNRRQLAPAETAADKKHKDNWKRKKCARENEQIINEVDEFDEAILAIAIAIVVLAFVYMMLTFYSSSVSGGAIGLITTLQAAMMFAIAVILTQKFAELQEFEEGGDCTFEDSSVRLGAYNAILGVSMGLAWFGFVMAAFQTVMLASESKVFASMAGFSEVSSSYL